MKIETTKGSVIAVIAWFVCEYIVIAESSCARLSNCGGFELLLAGIIGVGMVAPAWIAGSLFEDLLLKNK